MSPQTTSTEPRGRRRVKGRRTLFAATLLLASACATGERRAAPQVHSVRIVGGHQVKESDVKKHLVTTANSWVPFSRRQYFDEDAWNTDVRRIEKFYRARAFYQAKVTRAEVRPHGKRQVD